MVIRDRPGLYPLLLSLDGVRDLDALRRNARRNIPDLDVDVAEALAPLIETGAVIDNPEPHRRALRVEIAHDGPSTPLARCLGPLLRTLGVTVGPDADLLVVLSSGEPHRTSLADVVRCRLPHLVSTTWPSPRRLRSRYSARHRSSVPRGWRTTSWPDPRPAGRPARPSSAIRPVADAATAKPRLARGLRTAPPEPGIIAADSQRPFSLSNARGG
jgi:hypothetical protein